MTTLPNSVFHCLSSRGVGLQQIHLKEPISDWGLTIHPTTLNFTPKRANFFVSPGFARQKIASRYRPQDHPSLEVEDTDLSKHAETASPPQRRKTQEARTTYFIQYRPSEPISS